MPGKIWEENTKSEATLRSVLSEIRPWPRATLATPKPAWQVKISLMRRNAQAVPASDAERQNYVWYLPYPKTQYELRKSEYHFLLSSGRVLIVIIVAENAARNWHIEPNLVPKTKNAKCPMHRHVGERNWRS